MTIPLPPISAPQRIDIQSTQPALLRIDAMPATGIAVNLCQSRQPLPNRLEPTNQVPAGEPFDLVGVPGKHIRVYVFIIIPVLVDLY